DGHVERQRTRYRERLDRFRDILAGAGIDAALPQGGFYLWASAPDGDAWALTTWLAKEGGCLVSPGDFYGEAGSGHVRVAMVQPGDRLELVGTRLSSTADREGQGEAAGAGGPPLLED